MKTVLILGAGRWQMPLIAKARARGYRVLVADQNPKALGFAMADIPLICDIRSGSAILKEVGKIKIDAVVSDQTEVSLLAGAQVAAKLGLPYQKLDVIQRATNKYLMRQCWHERNIPIPKFRKAKTAAEVKAFAKEVGYPVVVKTPSSSGSQGVSIAHGPEQITAAIKYAKEFSKDFFLVESFVQGREYTVEAFSHAGKVHVLAISQKSKPESSYQVSTLLEYPPEFGEEEYRRMSETVAQAVLALGIKEGPSHTEVMLSPQGPILIETAARGGGFRISSDIIRLASGFDQTSALLDWSLGLTFEVKVAKRAAVTLGFFYPKPGVVRAVEGMKKAQAMPSVFALEAFVAPGDTCGELKSDRARAGYFILASDNAEENREATKNIYRTVKVLTGGKK